jgi:cell division protein ZapA (FtsZ GTPase activity inhibitor)
VTVEVAGQKLTLRTDAGEECRHALAAFVNEKIAEVKNSTRTFSTHALAILAALNIADERFQAREQKDELKKRVYVHVLVILVTRTPWRTTLSLIAAASDRGRIGGSRPRNPV